MTNNAEHFLSSFNRIEKWMRQEIGEKTNMGFSELVRQLSKRPELALSRFEEDLLQMAQLRNAIIHDQIAPDFVIAEPNEWVVKKMQQIEEALYHPITVISLFKKHVTGFEETISLADLLKIVAEKGYSQFPIYSKGKFKGLITTSGLGVWLAGHASSTMIEIKNKTAQDILKADRRSQNYRFVASQTTLNEAVHLFLNESIIEALLITKNGNPDGNLLGIIRPKDAFKNFYSE